MAEDGQEREPAAEEREPAAEEREPAADARPEPEPEGGAQDASGPGDATDGLPPELVAKARQADDYLAQLQRLKADFDNFRKRMMQEQARWSDAAVGRFIGELLPVVDNLERALEAGGDADAIRRGVDLTVRQLRELFAKAGAEPINPVGQPFDPMVHEAMLQVETADHPDGQVIAELRRGYLFKRQVLRPSLVQVARAPQAMSESRAADPAGPAAASPAEGPGDAPSGAESSS